MAKFSNASTVTHARTPIRSEGTTVTHEGAPAYTFGPQGELFLLAAVNMVGEDTFYEGAGKRDKRFADLVHEVTRSDPDWVRRFGPYLRSELKMRSASVVLACEFARAGGPGARALVDAVCQRADEPAEVIGYWTANYGRNVPQSVKRGVADAATRLYTERNYIKWDSSRRGVSFADVIELAHPVPKDQKQSDLFRFILDRAHHKDGKAEDAPLMARDAQLFAAPEAARRDLLRAEGMPNWWTWERLSGWLPGGMDAEAWEAVIPEMGVMALIRNLRNFDNARISEASIDAVIAKITDAEQVLKSRVFPYQVWTAYREAPSDTWRRALGTTLDLAMPNTPDLGPGTLVLIDTSASMTSGTVSRRSTVAPIEVAAVIGTALAMKHEDTDLAIFAQGCELVPHQGGSAALRVVEAIVGSIGRVGHATYINESIKALWNPAKHKRVIVFTDMQSHDSASVASHVPTIVHYDLGGYGRSNLDAGAKGRFVFGGFSDSTLACVAAIESVGHTGWPF